MASIRQLLWIAIFIISTLGFVVLFEHGPDNFGANLTLQIAEFQKMVTEQIQPPKKPAPDAAP